MRRLTATGTKITLVLALLTMVACKKFEDAHFAKTAWNPNLAIPIGHAKFGVYDVLAQIDSNDLIIIDPQTGEIALVYNSEIASFSSTSIVDFGTVSETIEVSLADLNIPASGSFNGSGNTFRTEPITVNMPNGVELDSVFFKAGTMNLHLESELRHDLDVTMTFTDMKKGGPPITRTFSKQFNGTVPQTEDIAVDLADVHADFTRGGITVNETQVDVVVKVTGTGEPINGDEKLSMTMSIADAEYHYVKGYFGQQTVGQSIDSVLLRVFQNAADGTFELRNPYVNFFIENSFGFPIQINLGNLKTINVNTGVENSLLNYPTTIDVNYPTQLGQVANTTFQLNSDNTDNLSSIISPTPKYFHYEVGATSNPANDKGIDNFIEDDSRFVLTAEVDMPLDGLAYGFSISDTLDFSFDQETDLIDNVTFRIIVDNGFPVRVGTQLMVLDENMNKLFDVFLNPEDIVEPAKVDVNGKVSQRVQKITDIPLSREQIDKLSKAKKVVVYGEASTTDFQNGTMVKFYDYYDIGIKLAMQVQGSSQF
ncbi:MAG: hypothetical protein EP338_05785 [Bacteroidetes bacterium]|nr:MAG: hypothetical protein EP338_05785 [Bacteroidota bacterium]